jgi:hypothetical protein
MIKRALHQVDYFIYNNCDITFLTVFILTHPVDFPCGLWEETGALTDFFTTSP